MQSSAFDKAFLGLGSLAAGAGVSAAVAGVMAVAVPAGVPVAGAVVALLATAVSGAFKRRALMVRTVEASDEDDRPTVS